MPAAEVEITVDLVRRLLIAQHSDLAEVDLTPVANGWDNALYRLGEDLLVRLPRRKLGAQLARNEARWLPELAPNLPLPIPTPVRLGAPTDFFPWHWAIVPWFEGGGAERSKFADPAREAARLGEFVAALHRPAPAGAPTNPLRGVPLAERSDDVHTWMEALAGEIDFAAVRAAWNGCVDVSSWSGPPMWIHGDLHPLNLVAHGGELAAVIDFGDICGGDPATDLLIAWQLFDAPDRAVFRAAADSENCSIDDDMWERGRGWAIFHSIAVLANSADAPAINLIGRRGLAAALE
jgi:aminoglycoside phosphotransferase (APT) family kinase protein